MTPVATSGVRRAGGLGSILGLLLAAGPIPAQEPSWEIRTPMPTPREKLAACVIGQHVYVVGGAPGENQPGLNVNERYRVDSDAWTTRQAMPTARRELAAAVLDGQCYAIGGRASRADPPLAVVEAYEPGSDSWTPKASLPEGRIYHAAVALNGRIYVVGGVTGISTFLDSMVVYDPVADQWTELAAMPTARAILAATALGGKVYAIGGTDNVSQTRFDVVEVYDPVSNVWTATTALPAELAGLSASAAGGRVYAIGGSGFGLPVTAVHAFDPGSSKWVAAPGLNVERNRHASAVVDGVIHVFGGSRQQAPPHPGIDSVEALAVGSGFVINAGLNDAWFNLATAGQGVFVNVFPVLGKIFVAIFTFDTEPPSQDATAVFGGVGQRWVTAFGDFAGNTAQLEAELTSGGIFDSPEPAPAQTPAYGTITLTFLDCNTLVLGFDFPGLGLSGEMTLSRIANDNVALCEALR